MTLSLHAFDHVSSTMDVARDLYQKKTPIPFYVTAQSQEKGRGRRGRSWVSAKGNLFATFVLPCALQHKTFISFVAALALYKALDTQGVKDLSLKWPNDVLLGGKKIAGILIEILEESQDFSVLSIGIGVNREHAPELVEVLYPATSLKASGYSIALCDLLEGLKTYLLAYLNDLAQGHWPDLCDQWISLRDKRHAMMTIQQGDRVIKGSFHNIDKEGCLLLKTETGEIKTFATGDVFF